MSDLKPTVFVVDDDQAVRESMDMLMRSGGWTVRTFGSASDFLERYEPADRGCLILDVRMPEVSGLELQQMLSQREIRLPIIMITGHGDVPVAVQAMRNGAVDFLQKPFSQQMLLERVKEAIELDGEIRRQLGHRAQLADRLASLTPRERQVLERVVAGNANKQVALDLGISTKTVEVHRAHVMEKMQADSLASLVAQAIACGLSVPWGNRPPSERPPGM